MYRKLVTHAAVFVVGLTAGIGAVAVADSQIHSASTDDAVVKQLKTLNRSIGTRMDKSNRASVRELLQDICESTGSYSGCGKPPLP